MNLRLPLLAVVLLLLASLGCSSRPNPGRVSGTVRYNGEPLKGGTVGFHAKDGNIFTATILPDGSYKVADVPKGEVVVTVETESINPKKTGVGSDYATAMGQKGPKGATGPKALAGKMAKANEGYAKAYAKDRETPDAPVAPPADSGTPKNYVKIPEKYSDPKKSDLTTTLGSGENTYNPELKD